MKEIYTFLAVSALSVGMAAPVLAADVEDQREELRQQSKDVLVLNCISNRYLIMSWTKGGSFAQDSSDSAVFQ